MADDRDKVLKDKVLKKDEDTADVEAHKVQHKVQHKVEL